MNFKKCFLIVCLLLITTFLFASAPIATIDGREYFQHSNGRYYYQNPDDGTYYFTNDASVISQLDAVRDQVPADADATGSPVASTDTGSEIVLSDEVIQALLAQLQRQGFQLSGLSTDAISPTDEADSPEQKSWWQSQVEDASFSYDLYFRTQMLRNATFSLGGGLNLGLETPSFKFEFYGLGDYYMKPIGGSGGAASLEFSIETGVMLGWKFMEVWRTRTYICLDMGWYAQFFKLPTDPDSNLYMGFNGIMFRPKIMTEIRISKHYAISIGLFYQFPLYPAYSDYRCLGAMVSIL